VDIAKPGIRLRGKPQEFLSLDGRGERRVKELRTLDRIMLHRLDVSNPGLRCAFKGLRPDACPIP
jgi:hypothetical protein